MQEDVARQTVQLAIRSGKVSGQLLWKALKAYVAHHNKKKAAKEVAKNTPIKGKQSVKQLVGQGQGVSSMDIGDTGIRDFKRIANKYGVDFAITKDRSIDPPKYTVFFKAKDADAITAVLKEYAAKQTKRKESKEKERPSILQKLKKFKEIVAKTPHKQKERRKEQER